MRGHRVQSRGAGRKSTRRRNLVLLLAAPLILAGGGEAHAYLDAGTGSMLVQFVIAAAVAFALSIRRVLTVIKKTLVLLVGRRFKRTPNPERY